MLISCEGMKFAEGVVVDKLTNKPIDSVLCKVKETREEVYTDSSGYYKVDGPFGGCIRECKDMHVEYSKPEYKTQIKLNPGGDYIYLEKE